MKGRKHKYRVWSNKSSKFVRNATRDIVDGFQSEDHPMGFVVEEWTGLVDKNGNPIFEGDVLKQHHSYIDIEAKDWIGVVKYSISQQGAAYYPSFSLYINEHISFNIRIDSEIIGNIHQNTDLIPE